MDWSAKEENGSTIIYIKESLSISKLVPLKEFLLDKMRGTKNNKEFMMSMNS